jgi:microcystin-dependent protein
LASGQILAINQNSALYSLFGTTFGIPNLAGRAAVSSSNGSPALGQIYGASSVNLTISQLPPHTHQLYASTTAVTQGNPSNALIGTFPAAEKTFTVAGAPANQPMSPNMIGATGSGAAVPTQSPSLGLTYCVATMGIFPSRP